MLVCLRAKRKQKKESTESEQSPKAEDPRGAQLEGRQVYEADNSINDQGHEMPVQDDKQELPGSYGATEVPQDQRFELGN